MLLMLVYALSVSGSDINIHRIKGIVLNQETGKPIPMAEVFISGTTYGSIINEKGEFGLKTRYLPCQLVVSHISYAPFSILIDLETLTFVTIKLVPYEHEIREISIEAMNLRKENLELFRQAFLGMDEIAYA